MARYYKIKFPRRGPKRSGSPVKFPKNGTFINPKALACQMPKKLTKYAGFRCKK